MKTSFYDSSKDPSKQKSKKVNFMIKMYVLEDLEKLIPAGKRSEFVNGALEEAVKDCSRRKAYEVMEKVRTEDKLKMTTAEILSAIQRGRK